MPLSVQIGLIFALALLNGALAMSEFAIVSSRPTRLQTMLDKNRAGARDALELVMNPGKFLSTLQLGMTLVGILSGAFSGATIGINLSAWLERHGLPTTVAHFIGVGVVVTAMTYLSVIIGELVPKRIALKDPENIACLLAPAMTRLSESARPVVLFLERSSDFVLSLLGQGNETKNVVTEDEIRNLAVEAESAGVIKPGESQMISGVLQLGDKSVRTIMTPRVKVQMINLVAPVSQSLEIVERSPYRCFPVHEYDPEKVSGLIWAKDLVNVDWEKHASLKPFVREAATIPADGDILDVVRILQKSPMHMGMVHDEFGSFIGIVTAADVLETIVGAFERNGVGRAAFITESSAGVFTILGSTPIQELVSTLDLILPPGKSYETAAGMLAHVFGHMPNVGETVAYQSWLFEIVELDGKRIAKFIATRWPDASTDATVTDALSVD